MIRLVVRYADETGQAPIQTPTASVKEPNIGRRTMIHRCNDCLMVLKYLYKVNNVCYVVPKDFVPSVFFVVSNVRTTNVRTTTTGPARLVLQLINYGRGLA